MVCTFEICIQNAKVPDSFDPGYLEVLGIYAIVYKAHLVRLSISHPELPRMPVAHDLRIGQVMQCEPPRALDNSLLGRVMMVFSTEAA